MLACDFSKMGNELEKVCTSGIDSVHMDIMDGIFVPNISFGPSIVKSLRSFTNLEFDVHLMLLDPINYIEDFAKSGADNITFHIESNSNPHKTIERIRYFKKSVGISLKPKTSPEEIVPFLPLVDLVLIMTVEPGFGGQTFLQDQISKIKKIRDTIDKNTLKCKIEVDGGINLNTAKLSKNAGADICVAGTSIFNSENVEKTISDFKLM